MSGRIRDTMADAIYKTNCVIVCVTKKYEEKVNSNDSSDNCFFEFDLAARKLANHRLPVVMENCMLNPYAWKNGRLDAELGGFIFIDLTNDDNDIFEMKVNDLASEINRLLSSSKK
jgi:hypothetical protein